MGIREALNMLNDIICSFIKGTYEFIRDIIKEKREEKKKK